MSSRPDQIDVTFESCKRRQAQAPWPPAWETALSVGGAVSCVVVIALIFWNAASGRAQPRLDYRHCGIITKEASRLACYDEAVRRGARRAKDVHRTTFGEILSRN